MKALRPTSRALALLVAGGIAIELLSWKVGGSWAGCFWAILIGVVYLPLARLKCPNCKHFPR